MGIYATTTSLQVLMIGTQFDSATTSLCDKLITHSENEINKHLSQRYTISSLQSPVPPLLTSLCETLTEGYMYQRMSRGGKDSMARGTILIKQVMDNLKLILDYKVNLVNSSGAVISDSPSSSYKVQSTTSDYSNTFNEDDPLNWEVDHQKLDDIFDERGG